jgi:hypothetical protein
MNIMNIKTLKGHILAEEGPRCHLRHSGGKGTAVPGAYDEVQGMSPSKGGLWKLNETVSTHDRTLFHRIFLVG